MSSSYRGGNRGSMKVKLRGPQRSAAKPRLQPQALATPTVPRHHERGGSGPFMASNPEGRGGHAPDRRGTRGPPAPSPAWVTPCGPASHLLPLSPVVTKELNHFRQREASRIRWALRIHPSEGSIRRRRQRLSSERHPSRPRLLDAFASSPSSQTSRGKGAQMPRLWRGG